MKENPDGYCLLVQARENVIKYWQSFSSKDDRLRNLLAVKLRSPIQTLVQFLIDPSTDSYAVQGVHQKVLQTDDVFKLTRTWCYALQRMKL